LLALLRGDVRHQSDLREIKDFFIRKLEKRRFFDTLNRVQKLKEMNYKDKILTSKYNRFNQK